ncbi:peptidase [Escherichia coli]|uniref:peptidase n=1 Tax=Escherichia coli TaxID=562 RepID=UPI0028E2820B|nr:peptidase [Escherichia coli]WNU78946.1 peptidase [Escherichia coli]
MSAIHIFKAGTHTDMHGKKLPFTPDDLAACVKAYDPSVHEAPLVIGHPRTEDPAWGWVKALSLSGVDLMAEPAQLDPQFAEMVTDGRFKKVSASFYLPDSPSNPKPGVLYLRHVGFLGAQPPSVKGLAITNASLWGKLRDFLIARFSLDEAEKVLPEWQLNSLREEAYRDTLSQDAAGAQFSETGPGPSSASNEESSMTKEEIEALQEENRRLKQQAADRDARDAQVRQEQLHKDNVAFAEKLVAEGRLAPRASSVVVALLDAVAGGDKPVEFAEGESRTPLATAFRSLLSDGEPVMNFAEQATKERVGDTVKVDVAEFAEADPERLALHQKAVALSKKEGISYEAAVARCL